MTEETSSAPSLTFGRARPSDEDGLALTLGSLTWAGPLVDGDEEARRRRYRLEVRDASPPETDVVDWLRRILPLVPLPPHGYRRLADRLFVDHPARARAFLRGTEEVDACLVRALMERRPLESGAPRVRLEQRVLLTFDPEAEALQQAMLRSDSSLVAISHRRATGYRVHLDVDGIRSALDVPPDVGRPMLLRPLGSSTLRAAEAEQEVELVAYDYQAKICSVFPGWQRGDASRTIRFPLGREPMHVLRAEGRLFVQSPAETVGLRIDAEGEVDEPSLVRIPHLGNRAMASEHPLRFGRFLTGVLKVRPMPEGPEVPTLAWFDLRGELAPVPTGAAPAPLAMARHGDELWVLSTGVLHRMRPGEVAREVARGDFVALAVSDLAIWVGERHGGAYRITRLAHGDHARISTTPVSVVPSTMLCIADGVLALSALSFVHVRGDGSLGAWSDSRRIAGFARARDGSTVACAAEELLFLGHDGSTRCRRTMPYDGAIAGPLGDYFLFAPCGSGWQRSRPDAIHVLDTDGVAVGRLGLDGDLVPLLGTGHRWDEERFVHRGDGDVRAALMRSADGRQLLSLTPGPLAWSSETTSLDDDRLVWTLPSRNGEKIRRPAISNPRDDFPEPGISVHGAAIVLRSGSYEGTPDSAHGPAVEARHGALVVLEDCDLGAHGVGVVGDASVILIGCRGGTSTSVETCAQGRVFRFDDLAAT